MSYPVLTNLDLNLNQLLNAVLQVLASDPGAPVEGQVWYDSTADRIEYRDGTGTRQVVSQTVLDAALATLATDAELAAAISAHEADTSVHGIADTTVLATDAEVAAAVANYVPLTQRAAANGVATLDAGSKIPVAQLPASAMTFLGVWNASTNTPTLADGTGDAGDTYRVSVAGTRNLGSGAQDFAVGDLVLYDGAVWQRSDSTDAVSSVAGKTGVVTLVKGDVGLGNVDNTSDANKPVSTAQQTALDLKANLASPTFTGNPQAPTPAADDNDTSIATTAYVQGEIADRAPLASPVFTGNPTAPTPAVDDNDQSIATTGWVQAELAAVGGIGKYAADITGDAVATQFTVTHNRGTKDVVVSVFDVSNDLEVIVDIKRPTINTCRIDFAVAPAGGKVYRVVVVG